MHIPAPLQGHALAMPQQLALCDGFAPGSRSLSYAELATDAQHVAQRLRAQGLGPEMKVALLGPHGFDFVRALHGLLWLGATVVPLPNRAPPAALQARLARAGASQCVALQGSGQDMQLACAEQLRRPCLMFGHGVASELPAGRPLAPAPWQLHTPLLMLETSGTSGHPTSVTLTPQHVLFQSLGSSTRLGHHVGDIWLNVLPLHHVGGLLILFRALLFGAAVCVPGRFDAHMAADLMSMGPITLTSLVPTMLADILPLLGDRRCHPGLRAILLGGAPTPSQLHQRAVARGLPIALTWGMTETTSGICVGWPQRAADDVRNAGPPLPYVTVGTDASGMLQVAGPQVAASAEGAFTTNDRGEVLADGSVRVLGRRDRMLISGGENISAEAVEAVLLAHPNILDAAVVGEADPRFGDRPVAHLVATSTPVSDADLETFCRARLASYEVPVRYTWHAQLPRDTMGKLQRKALTPLQPE